MFQSLSEKLQDTLGRLRKKGKLSEKDLDEGLREVRLALLEADVNFKVVKEFIKSVKTRSMGAEVMESLTPGQQVIKIVNEELTRLMGESQAKINLQHQPPTIVLMSGLQGAGKTTTCGKLALHLKKQQKSPLLVACDVYRPAAIHQLEVLGKQINVPVFSMGDKTSPVDIAKAGVQYAKKNSLDVVLIDTAGRLHIDEEMMDEIIKIHQAIKPHEVLLVLDAMTGQEAVSVAQAFNNALDLTGVILSKLDGDARGGAALSLRSVTDKPIKFVSMGEKLDQLEPFHPDRMASRILGMGDVLSLIDKAVATFDEKKAKELEEKMLKNSFTLDDYLDQIEQMKNMGPIDELINLIPGMNKKALKGVHVDEKDILHIQAIIQSMTPKERRNPDIINSSRRRRIALGSGMSVSDVNKLLKQFKDMKKMMKRFTQMGKSMKQNRGFGFPFMS